MSAGDLYYSLDQYFPHDQRLMLQNHARLKDSFQVQAGPVDLNVTGYEKFVAMVSDSTLCN